MARPFLVSFFSAHPVVVYSERRKEKAGWRQNHLPRNADDEVAIQLSLRPRSVFSA